MINKIINRNDFRTLQKIPFITFNYVENYIEKIWLSICKTILCTSLTYSITSCSGVKASGIGSVVNSPHTGQNILIYNEINKNNICQEILKSLSQVRLKGSEGSKFQLFVVAQIQKYTC